MILTSPITADILQPYNLLHLLPMILSSQWSSIHSSPVTHTQAHIIASSADVESLIKAMSMCLDCGWHFEEISIGENMQTQQIYIKNSLAFMQNYRSTSPIIMLNNWLTSWQFSSSYLVFRHVMTILLKGEYHTKTDSLLTFYIWQFEAAQNCVSGNSSRGLNANIRLLNSVAYLRTRMKTSINELKCMKSLHLSSDIRH